MKRPEVSNKNLLQAVESVTISLGQRIEEKGLGTFVSPHEMLGVISEEYHELIDAVRQNDPVDVGNELADIAVACIFSIASMLEGTEQIKAAKEALEAEMTVIQGSEG